jgi:nicotinamidase/pyrazinamidase
VTRYDERTTLVVVDVQNDFADPAGSLYVRGGEEAVPVVIDEIAAAKAAGALVVYSQDWHPPTSPHFKKDGGVWPVHCVQDTWGAAFHPRLPVGDDIVIRKGADGGDGYSAFSVRDPLSGMTLDTELERVLRAHDIARIVVCGLATDYCVVETVVDARTLGLDVEVVSAAIRAVELAPGAGQLAITRMRDAGAEIT